MPNDELPPFALFASQRLPLKPDPFRAVALPLPRPEHEDPVMEFLYSKLFLPSGFALRCEVAPRGVFRGCLYIAPRCSRPARLRT